MKKTGFSTALLLAGMFVFLPSTAMSNQINPTRLAQLKWQDVPYAETLVTKLSENQSQDFIQPLSGIASPVAAYRIPANQGTIEIDISSPIADNKVFVPNAVVLDSHFNVATRYPSSEFKFQTERGLSANRFTAELNLTPTLNQDYIYLLIYTTAEDLQKTTMIPHPAKVFAQATGKQPPSLPDIEVKHSRSGEINIHVTAANGTRFIGIPTAIFGGSKATQPAAQAAVIGQSTPTSPPQMQAKPQTNAVKTPVEKDTEAYFKQAVRKALKENDINRAMNLVNEAEKLGLTSPRQIFLQQVSSK